MPFIVEEEEEGKGVSYEALLRILRCGVVVWFVTLLFEIDSRTCLYVWID